MSALYDSILDTVGNTPTVRLNHLGPAHVNLYGKLEAFNPVGSVKDRMALAVIEHAEQSGELQPGQTIVEGTSGNTGIALAMVCAQKGYPLVITMAENFSVERRKLMRFLGARVVLTPAAEKGSGMVRKARELAARHGWWQPRQFENPVAAEVHERTTAREILDAFADTTLDYWVSGFGSGGTFTGVSRALRAESPHTRIVLCEPDNSAMIGSGIAQARTQDGEPSESHPRFRPHIMQGWTPDFIPALAQEFVDEKRYDIALPIAGEEALQCAKDLARKEGILAGITAGAAVAGALQFAKTAPGGSNILCMIPDTGERYLSTVLFEDVPAEMTDEEMEIANSTVVTSFESPEAAAMEAELPEPEAEAVEAVDQLIAGREQPVLMFGLAWCEFCWSVRKVLKAYGIDYQAIDLDAPEYQEKDRGSELRLALRHQTGSNTFPQIFVGGEFIGGCTDLFDGILDRSIFEKLKLTGATLDTSVTLDPYSLMPGWVQPAQAV